MVVWLLSLGADPSGDSALRHGVGCNTIGILQLLIDAGSDVNLKSVGLPPLITAVAKSNRDDSEEQLRVLLAQPSLDFTITYFDVTPLEYARDFGKPVVVDMIAQEVSGTHLSLVALS